MSWLMVGMAPLSAVMMTHMSVLLSAGGETHYGRGSWRGVGVSRAFAHDVGGFELVEFMALEVAPHVVRPFECDGEACGGGVVPSGERAQFDGVRVRRPWLWPGTTASNRSR